MSNGHEPQDVEVRFVVPPELEAGTYAETVVVWHTAHAFVLDFAAVGARRYVDAADLDTGVEIPARVVARVRLPPGLIFSLLQAINASMGTYEHEWGEIRPPRRKEQDEPEENA